MLRVIGSENCGRCNIVLNLLKDKEVAFNYEKMKDLSFEEQKLLTDKAKQKKQLSFPLILKDGELVTLQEVI